MTAHMSPDQDDAAPQIDVTDDASEARLHVPGAFARDQVTLGLLKTLVKERGVEYTKDVEMALHEAIDQLPPDGEDAKFVIARATEPMDGQDGYIQWLVEEPDEQPPELSFYHRSPYVMVEMNDVVGQWHEPTPGEDGRDVTGETRPAKPGKAVPWKVNEDTVLVDGRGQLVAQLDGMLVRADGKVYVTKVMNVNGAVDFSTGHIDFDGDVCVAGAVRDLFEVRATGSVEVGGLIEAATIHADGDLVACGGIAAREQGHIQIGGNLFARHLNAVQGHVSGMLRAEREILHCQLTVGGDVNVPNGAIIGGDLTIGGRVDVATIGSAGEMRTHLILGSAPNLEHQRAKLDQLIKNATERRDQYQSEMDALMATSQKLSAADRERQTELMFEIQQVEQLLQKMHGGRKQVDRALAHNRVIEINAAKMIYPGVRLQLGANIYRFVVELRGPVRVYEAEDRTPVYQRGNTPARPLQEVAQTSAAEIAETGDQTPDPPAAAKAAG